jgi:hypothetical protein
VNELHWFQQDGFSGSEKDMGGRGGGGGGQSQLLNAADTRSKYIYSDDADLPGGSQRPGSDKKQQPLPGQCV